MTQSKHTPGPWVIQRGAMLTPAGAHAISPVDGGFPDVAWVNADSEENEANARLIAASPDLLEAALMEEDLRRLGELLGTSNIHGIVAIIEKYPLVLHQDMAEETAWNVLMQHVTEKRQAAIAKARGES